MSDHGATGEREATPPREMEIAMTPRPVTGRGSSQIENKGERLGSGGGRVWRRQIWRAVGYVDRRETVRIDFC